VSAADRRSALVVVADAAEPVLRETRRRYLHEAVERGIPAHITILFPFVPDPDVDDGTLDALRRLYAPVPAFAYALTSIESFPDAVWLAPRPVEPFLELVERTRAAFPDRPPYGDPAQVPVPHCTIGTDDDPQRVAEMVDDLRARLAGRLPIPCRAVEVALVGEGPEGVWVTREVFPLAGAG
jgi:2'-5' RNA ligase